MPFWSRFFIDDKTSPQITRNTSVSGHPANTKRPLARREHRPHQGPLPREMRQRLPACFEGSKDQGTVPGACSSSHGDSSRRASAGALPIPPGVGREGYFLHTALSAAGQAPPPAKSHTPAPAHSMNTCSSAKPKTHTFFLRQLFGCFTDVQISNNGHHYICQKTVLFQKRLALIRALQRKRVNTHVPSTTRSAC